MAIAVLRKDARRVMATTRCDALRAAK